jgi:hypothetical protein
MATIATGQTDLFDAIQSFDNEETKELFDAVLS